MEKVLAESNNYIITFEYEVAFLVFKNSGRKVIIGDFYGDPETAFISDDESFCAVGGYGLIIYYLKEPFIEFEYNVDSVQWKEVFREPDDIWWVEEISKSINSRRVRFTVDPLDEQRTGIYEIDVTTLEFSKVL